MRKLQKTKGKTNFPIAFYKSVVFVFFLLGIFLVLLGSFLSENFFLSFTINNKLTETAVKRITNFRIFISLIGFLILCISLFVKMNKNAVIKLIEKRRILLQNLMLLFFSILVFILMFEFVARAVLPEETKFSFSPGQVSFFNKYVHLNKEGYRDVEHSITKNTRFRVAVIGDSYTFGSGIRNFNQTYSKQLERLLNNNSKNKNYEVMNFGKPGVDTEFEIKILKNDVVKHKPDIIIIGYVLNDYRDFDATKTTTNTYLFWFDIFLKRYSYLYYFAGKGVSNILEISGVKRTYYDSIIETLKSSKNKELNAEYFKELNKISNANNAKLVIVIFPFIYQLDNYPFAEQHKIITKIGNENGVIVIDLLPYFENIDESKIIVSKYDNHPNELGHEIIAKAIYERLIKISLVS